MAKHKIPPSMVPAVLERAGAGQSGQEIAAWLGHEHGIQVTGRAVLGLLQKVREERAPIAEAVITEKLGQTLAADLDALDGLMQRAGEIETEARTTGDLANARLSIGEQRQLLELRFKLSGAGQPQEAGMLVILPRERPVLIASDAVVDASGTPQARR